MPVCTCQVDVLKFVGFLQFKCNSGLEFPGFNVFTYMYYIVGICWNCLLALVVNFFIESSSPRKIATFFRDLLEFTLLLYMYIC